MRLTNQQLQLHFVIITIALLIQMSYSIYLANQLRGEHRSDPTIARPGGSGLCVLTEPKEKLPIRFNLTGKWMTNDRALCTVKQKGEQVTWKAISSYDNGRTFTHTFHGKLDGDILRGHFYDHAPGMNRNSGDLTFKVVSPTKFVLKHSTGAFGAREFTRQKRQLVPFPFGRNSHVHHSHHSDPICR